jgi:hypothetical protein
MPISDINRPLSIIIFVLYLSIYRVILGRIYDQGLYLRFKPIVGVVNVYTMVPCHKITATLGELYLYFKGPYGVLNVKFDQCAQFTIAPIRPTLDKSKMLQLVETLHLICTYRLFDEKRLNS